MSRNQICRYIYIYYTPETLVRLYVLSSEWIFIVSKYILYINAHAVIVSCHPDPLGILLSYQMKISWGYLWDWIIITKISFPIKAMNFHMLNVHSMSIRVIVNDVASSVQVSAAGGLLLYIIKLSLTLGAIPSTAEYQHHLWELLPIKARLQ